MKSLLPGLCLILATIVLAATGALCPGGRVRCQADQTCCLLQQGGYACCPYQLATCCSDGLHCCPHQTTCDTAHGRCLSSHPILTKLIMAQESPRPVPSLLLSQEDDDDDSADDEAAAADDLVDNTLQQLQQLPELGVGKKTCPDGIQSCPDTYTCCSLVTGGFGCCPLDGGVCCPDQVHCCPNGSRCSNSTGGGCDA